MLQTRRCNKAAVAVLPAASDTLSASTVSASSRLASTPDHTAESRLSTGCAQDSTAPSLAAALIHAHRWRSRCRKVDAAPSATGSLPTSRIFATSRAKTLRSTTRTSQQFLDQYDSVARTWPKDWSDSALSIVGYYRQWGCDYIRLTAWQAIAQGAFPANWGGVIPCIEHGTFWPIKPMSSFCPVACGCLSGTAAHGTICPGLCPSSAAITAAVDAEDQAYDSDSSG